MVATAHDARSERYLVPGETQIHACRRHPMVLLGAIFLWLIAVAAALALGYLYDRTTGRSMVDLGAGGVALAATIYAGVRVVQWRSYRYVLTDLRIMIIDGVFARSVSSVPFTKVADSSYRRSLLGRIFGFGELRFDVSGERAQPVALTKVPRPDEVFRLISAAVLRVKDGGQRHPADDDTGPLPRITL